MAPPRPGFDSRVEQISGPWGKKIPSSVFISKAWFEVRPNSQGDGPRVRVGQGFGVFLACSEKVTMKKASNVRLNILYRDQKDIMKILDSKMIFFLDLIKSQ